GLLLVTEVLAAVGDIAEVGRRGNGFVRIEGQVGEAVGALQPHGLLAAIFGDLVARIGVVQGKGHAVRRPELQYRLAIEPLTLEVRKRVADVVRQAVQLTDRRRVGDDGVRAQRDIRAGPALDVPGV